MQNPKIEALLSEIPEVYVPPEAYDCERKLVYPYEIQATYKIRETFADSIRPFWVAEYSDGEILDERKMPNKFHDLDKERVIAVHVIGRPVWLRTVEWNFGRVGNWFHHWLDLVTGVFWSRVNCPENPARVMTTALSNQGYDYASGLIAFHEGDMTVTLREMDAGVRKWPRLRAIGIGYQLGPRNSDLTQNHKAILHCDLFGNAKLEVT
jgi:hypothetical protein